MTTPYAPPTPNATPAQQPPETQQTPPTVKVVLPQDAIAQLQQCTTAGAFYSLRAEQTPKIDPAKIDTYNRLAGQIEASRGFTMSPQNPDHSATLRLAIAQLAERYNSLDPVDRKQAMNTLSQLSKSCGIPMTNAELTKAVQAKANDIAHAKLQVTGKTVQVTTPDILKVTHKSYASHIIQNLHTRYLPESRMYITYSPHQQKWVYNNDGKDFTDKLHATIAQQTNMAQTMPPCQLKQDLIENLEKTESANFVRDVIAYSRSLPEFSIRADALDKHKNLLNCQNGTLDLDSYQFKDADPADLLTQVTATRYDPTATCPQWEACIADIHSNDTDTLRFLQTYLGYSLLGTPTEKLMLILHGSRGNNGKSLITGTLLQLLKDYGVSARPSIICLPAGATDQSNSGHNTDLMKLQKRRLINFNEAVGNFKTQMVKQLVGDLGAGISAREINGKETTIYIDGSIIVDTNSVPGIPSNDEATWRRIQVIPYKRYYIKSTDPLETQSAEIAKGNVYEDTTLASRLQAEYPGILNWLIAGLKNYRAHGLTPTQSMVDTKARLRLDRDPLQQWLAQTLKTCLKAEAAPRKDLWDAWQAYETANATSIFRSSATFYAALEQKGYEIYKYHGEWVIKEKAIRTKDEIKQYIADAKAEAEAKANPQTTLPI